MPTVDIDKIAVGDKYRNNTVMSIDEEVKDLKNGKVKIRKLIKLDDGMIVIEDALYDFEEIVGEYKELQYNEIAFPDMSPSKKKKKKKKDKKQYESPPTPIPVLDTEDDEDEEESRRETEQAAIREAEQKERLEAEEKARHEAQEAARHEAEERARMEAEEEETRRRTREAEERAKMEAEEEENRRRRREAEERARMEAEEEENRRREAEADLRRKEAQELQRIKQLRDSWAPQTIFAYTSHNEDEGDFPRGVWKVPPGFDTAYDTEAWPVKEVLLYPPNKFLPSSSNNTPHGYWQYSDPSLQPSERDTEWIPLNQRPDAPITLLLPGQEKPHHSLLVGEWCMNDSTIWPPPKQPKTYTIHPPGSIPSNSLNGDQNAGIWRVGSQFPGTDDGDWILSEVLAYEAGHEPQTLSEDKTQGPWGVAKGAEPNENGCFHPSDVWFLMPGEKMPDEDEWDCRGTWVLDSEKNKQWPPYKLHPVAATVHHEENGDPSHGAWIENSGIKACDWRPQKVLAYVEGHGPENVDSSQPQGLWGRTLEARPDADGNYAPTDTWYVFPGEDAPCEEEWDCQGTWVADPNEAWLPFEESPPEPQKFNVKHPGSDDPGNGIWRFGDGFPNDIEEDNWELAPVLAYELGDEPEDLNDKPHGLWGRAVDAKADENGNYDPHDTWFIYPEATPPGEDEWNCCGAWMLDNAASAQWPPYSESSPSVVEPTLATIFPEKKAAKEIVESGKPKGTWKYTPGKKVMDAGKKPKNVLLFMDGQEIDEDAARNGGVWGYAPGAEPDPHGCYSPIDLWCFAQGEMPPPDNEWQCQGRWIPKDPPTELKPTSTSNDSQTSTKSSHGSSKETVKRKITRIRRFPDSAWVFPSEQHAPAGQKGNLQGVWSTPPGDQPGGKLGVKYKEGEPMEVIVHKRGKEPSESDLKKMASGKWGYTKAAKPNDRGIMDPKDIIFFPPGIDCSSDVNEEGIWSCPGALIKETTAWRFDDDHNIVHLKTTEILFMGETTKFTTEYVSKK